MYADRGGREERRGLSRDERREEVLMAINTVCLMFPSSSFEVHEVGRYADGYQHDSILTSDLCR